MAIVVTVQGPSREIFERVAAEARFESDKPAGLVFMTASELPDGSVRVVSVWESKEQLDEFRSTRLIPAFKAVGAGEPGTPQVLEAFRVIS